MQLFSSLSFKNKTILFRITHDLVSVPPFVGVHTVARPRYSGGRTGAHCNSVLCDPPAFLLYCTKIFNTVWPLDRPLLRHTYTSYSMAPPRQPTHRKEAQYITLFLQQCFFDFYLAQNVHNEIFLACFQI